MGNPTHDTNLSPDARHSKMIYHPRCTQSYPYSILESEVRLDRSNTKGNPNIYEDCLVDWTVKGISSNDIGIDREELKGKLNTRGKIVSLYPLTSSTIWVSIAMVTPMVTMATWHLNVMTKQGWTSIMSSGMILLSLFCLFWPLALVSYRKVHNSLNSVARSATLIRRWKENRRIGRGRCATESFSS